MAEGKLRQTISKCCYIIDASQVLLWLIRNKSKPFVYVTIELHKSRLKMCASP